MCKSAYEIATENIIMQLEKGIIPWHNFWTSGVNGAYNWNTEKPHNLLNQMLLTPGEYLTYNQALKASGNVRQGEKGSHMVLWTMRERKKGNVTPNLKWFSIFNIEQCDGLTNKVKHEYTVHNSMKEADEIIAAYIEKENLSLRIVEKKKSDTFYQAKQDYIKIRSQEYFSDITEYYWSLFYTIIRSTGHPKRLNRFEKEIKTMPIGKSDFKLESLVDDIGAAMLLHKVGLETPNTFKNSAIYIQSWIAALESDVQLIVKAAGKAEKAVNYLFEKEETRENNGEVESGDLKQNTFVS